MTQPKFIEILFMTGYPNVLLNRGQDNMAKRAQFGDATRTRVSSQAQKQRWGKNEDANSLHNVPGIQRDVRSREIVTDLVLPKLAELGHGPELLEAVADAIQQGVYGDKGTDRHNRPTMLLGLPEVEYITERVDSVLQDNPDPEEAQKAIRAMFISEKVNFLVMNEMTRGRQGIRGALFGRFTTSFDEANIDSAVHVAHAITPHTQENVIDHFSTVDDLNEERNIVGSAHMGENELTSCILVGYVVVDVAQLVANLEAVKPRDWLEADRELAAQIVRNLIMTIATVTPGAKKGSTAPYSYADFLMVEAGDQQPRNLQEAFREPVESAQMEDTAAALSDKIAKIDRLYGNHRARRVVSQDGYDMPGATRMETLQELTGWTADVIRAGDITLAGEAE